MAPDKVDAGWTKKGGEQGEEELEQDRRRRKMRKEIKESNINSSEEKLTERDIYMINKGIEMEMKMRTGGGVGGGAYRDLLHSSYQEYRLPQGLVYQQRNYDMRELTGS